MTVVAADVNDKAAQGIEVLPALIEHNLVTLRFRGVWRGSVVEFSERLEFPETLDDVDGAVLRPLVRLLSLVASLSYFKAFAPGDVTVDGGLTDAEREFARTVTVNGLGEFAFVNEMPEIFSTQILGDTSPHVETRPPSTTCKRALVAVGGGKDSVVSIEALRAAGIEVGLFSVNSYGPIVRCADVAGLKLHTVTRRLDPQLFTLNEDGAPNGHVPVTAVNSLIALIAAAALGFDTVVFSNEASSSFGNVAWRGALVNHQWSKSIEFERLLRSNLPEGSPNYVSLLRPVSELRIARRFAALEAYHGVFTSCNRAFKLHEADRTSWCADCPKCRFVFLCLAPFVSRPQLLAIFGGRDMFADPSQLDGFLELMGLDGLLKPFECVGEPDECRVALHLLRRHPEWQNHPFLDRPEIAVIRATPAEEASVFAFREAEHCLAPELAAVAREV